MKVRVQIFDDAGKEVIGQGRAEFDGAATSYSACQRAVHDALREAYDTGGARLGDAPGFEYETAKTEPVLKPRGHDIEWRDLPVILDPTVPDGMAYVVPLDGSDAEGDSPFKDKAIRIKKPVPRVEITGAKVEYVMEEPKIPQPVIPPDLLEQLKKSVNLRRACGCPWERLGHGRDCTDAAPRFEKPE
jgi:hypothetical protein